MGFGNRRRSQAVEEPVDAPQRRKSLFSRRSSGSPARNGTAATNGHSSGGLFNRRRSSSPRTSTGNGHSSGGLLHRRHDDPAVMAAHERVSLAETAERDADRALINARSAVKNARDEVKRLEREAAEEMRMAKHKHSATQSISKRGKALGRHT